MSNSGRIPSRRRDNLEMESDGSPSHQYKYNQSETSDEHLELIEKDSERKILGGQGKYKMLLYKLQ